MKLFILLSLALVCFASPLGTFNQLDVSQANTNPIIKSCLEFGIEHLLEEGLKEGLIPDSDLTLSRVNSIESQVSRGVNYRFTVELKNERGAEVTSTFTVHYALASGEITWTDNYDYQYMAPYTSGN